MVGVTQPTKQILFSMEIKHFIDKILQNNYGRPLQQQEISAVNVSKRHKRDSSTCIAETLICLCPRTGITEMYLNYFLRNLIGMHCMNMIHSLIS